jgi:hypothetical protein
VHTIIRHRLEARKARNERRLDKFRYPDDMSQPMLGRENLKYELAGRAVGTAYGGIGLMQQLVRELNLAEAINARVQLFQIHLPYHESDHVLSLAYNVLCDGRCLEDLELRRQDEAYLNLLGASRIPDPTTAGDFCRRFKQSDLQRLQEAYDVARRQVWARQPPEFFDEARIDADGKQVVTGAECRQGVDINHKGEWGYHALVVSLANTKEVLRLVNRPGNRPSHEGAAAMLDECIALCREAGFRKIVLRGDTDFSQTRHLDRWHEPGDVTFLFGYDCSPYLHLLADDLPKSAWKPLERPAKYTVQTTPRAKPARFKQRIVEQRGYKDIHLEGEQVAEFAYRPTACRHTYRMIVVRKNLSISEPRQGRFFEPDYRYFFYITNQPPTVMAERIVFAANDRCDQENLLAQLSACRALHAPVDNLLSNWAYMLMTALAWNLKAWLALWLPADPGRWQERHQTQQQTLLTCEFRTFVNHLMRVPCQVVKTGRQLVLRLLVWNHWQPLFFRLADQFAPTRRSHPRRC